MGITVYPTHTVLCYNSSCCRIMRCEILQWLSVVILWSDLLLFMDGCHSRMKEYQLLYNPLDHSCDYIGMWQRTDTIYDH